MQMMPTEKDVRLIVSVCLSVCLGCASTRLLNPASGWQNLSFIGLLDSLPAIGSRRRWSTKMRGLNPPMGPARTVGLYLTRLGERLCSLPTERPEISRILPAHLPAFAIVTPSQSWFLIIGAMGGAKEHPPNKVFATMPGLLDHGWQDSPVLMNRTSSSWADPWEVRSWSISRPKTARGD